MRHKIVFDIIDKLSFYMIWVKNSFSYADNCCDTISVEIRGEAMDAQDSRAGIYSYTGDINGRKYWLKSDGTRAIWYVPDSKDWAIGSNDNLGSKTGGIFSTGNLETQCPHDKQNNWKYYDEEWISSNDVRLNCNAGI